MCGRETLLHPHNKMTKAKAISKEEQRAIEMSMKRRKFRTARDIEKRIEKRVEKIENEKYTSRKKSFPCRQGI